MYLYTKKYHASYSSRIINLEVYNLCVLLFGYKYAKYVIMLFCTYIYQK